jgi:ATP-dependent DNA helicase RecQ
MALTATATPRVQQDIIQQLALRQPIVRRFSFNRPNLYYEVQPRQQRTYPQILDLIRSFSGASGIIYCLARKTTEKLAADLQKDNIAALPYHAGLTDRLRSQYQEQFIRDDVQVMVATVAFGMGINKPDVRFVIHHDLPRNLESYYQESGRAGRDGEAAHCILLYNPSDEFKINYFIKQKNNLQEQKIAREQLKQVLAYAQTSYCRRILQLSYFGETFPGNCGGCDNCLNPPETEDWTIEAQKFLSCVARTRERFGAKHLIEILRGSQSKKITQYGHHLLSTYGIGKDRSTEQWQHLARSLVEQQLVNQTNDGYNVFKLNKQSWLILRQKKKVEIAVFSQNNAPHYQEENPRKLRAELLLTRLKQLRKKLADQEGIAPYVVFGDSTLRLMAQMRPQTLTKLSRLSGVTEYKLNKYGDDFVQAIRAFTPEQIIPPALPTATQMKTLQLYQQGLTVAEIAQHRGFAISTITEHISELIELNQPIDINNLVEPTIQGEIINAIEQVGEQSLKRIKQHLQDMYTYEQIKLVRAWYRRQRGL